MFKHILVPIDGSPMSEAALPAAAFLAEKLRARVTLMHVVERNAPDQVHGQPHLKHPQEAECYLREIARRAFSKECQIDVHVHTNEWTTSPAASWRTPRNWRMTSSSCAPTDGGPRCTCFWGASPKAS